MDVTDDWGLGWIQEELKQLDFSSLGCEGGDDQCVQPSSVKIQKSPEYFDAPLGYTESVTDKDKDIIYASVSVSPVLHHSKDATRFITEKYDTLGRVKVDKPQLVSTLTRNNIPSDFSSPAVEQDDVWISSTPMYDQSRTYESTSKGEFQRVSHYSPVTSDYHSQRHRLEEDIPVSSPLPPCTARKLTYENQNTHKLQTDGDSNLDYTLSTLSRKYMSGCGLVVGEEMEQNNLEFDSSKTHNETSNTNMSGNNSSSVVTRNGVDTSGWETQTNEYIVGESPNMDYSTPELASQSYDHLSEHEILQVEMFYRSHNTDVFVCKCSADLLLGKPSSTCSNRVSTALSGQNNRLSQIVSSRPATSKLTDAVVNLDNWTFVKTGIPVVVMDGGDGRRQRKLHIILAERGTGFTLWRDSVDYLTDYNAISVNFHTMHLSSDHTRLAGLRFEKAIFAGEFAQKIHKLTLNPADSLFNLAGSKKSKKVKKPKTKFKRPTKGDISLPCCMTHITKLDPIDGQSILHGDNCRSE